MELFVSHRVPDGKGVNEVFIDNSAFLIKREMNESKEIGENTFPLIDGYIWHINQSDMFVSVASSKATGTVLNTKNNTEVLHFLARHILHPS